MGLHLFANISNFHPIFEYYLLMINQM